MAKQVLKKIPGFSQGVRDNSSIRMVKMMQPICPYSQFEVDVTPEGRLVPRRDPSPERQNCQKEGAGWWDNCVERGHDPYFRTRVWYSKKDIFSDQCSTCPPEPTKDHVHDPATTEQVKTDERVIRHEEKKPNVAQVAAHMRVNSARGPRLAYANKGFRMLAEFGYADVCQYRNCQHKVKVKSSYGLYCSKKHAALCAADGIGMPITQIPGRFDEGRETQIAVKRQRELQEAAAIAQVTDI